MPVGNSARINIEMFPFFNSEKYKCQKNSEFVTQKKNWAKKFRVFVQKILFTQKKKEQKIQVNSKDVTKKGPTVLLGKQI